MKRYTKRLLFFIYLLTVSVTGVYADGEEKVSLTWKDYSVIAERNIFSKNRSKRTESFLNRTQARPAAAGKEESYLILRGITKHGADYTAFIEDSRTMEVKMLKKGAAVAGGTVSEINMDYLKFESEGKSITVKMGMALEGREAAVMPAYTPAVGVTIQQGMTRSVPKTVSNTDSSESDDKKSILQRLKERRKKELGE